MVDEACCTCATLLSAIPPPYDVKTEKQLARDRRLDCCGRVVCGMCITNNSRFATYCPFCQISSGPSSLPPQGLREPPGYSPFPSPRPSHGTPSPPPDIDGPPAYSTLNPLTSPNDEVVSDVPTEDVLHFLDPSHDTIPSLSLRYGVPQDALRRTNGLFADHLLAARRKLLIPGKFYKGGVSLSPQPIEGEEEEMRKAKVRRWMVTCKVADIPMRLRYDVAILYLNQSKYDLGMAVEAYLADEKWEKEHPMDKLSKGKMPSGRRKFGMRTGLSGQL